MRHSTEIKTIPFFGLAALLLTACGAEVSNSELTGDPIKDQQLFLDRIKNDKSNIINTNPIFTPLNGENIQNYEYVEGDFSVLLSFLDSNDSDMFNEIIWVGTTLDDGSYYQSYWFEDSDKDGTYDRIFVDRADGTYEVKTDTPFDYIPDYSSKNLKMFIEDTLSFFEETTAKSPEEFEFESDRI